MNNINHVMLVAGTHGNELSGIYIQKLIRDRLINVGRSSFETSSVLANPRAVQSNVRFIDADLNRLFSSLGSNSNLNAGMEGDIAADLKHKYSCKENLLVIDMHNTTSKMGATLILLSEALYYKRMGAYVKQRMPEANILFEIEKSWQEQPYLCCMGAAGVMIEVAEQSHSVLSLTSLDMMKTMLLAVLDFIEAENLDTTRTLPDYDAYYFTQEVSFPVDEQGMRLATVHPTLEGMDFKPVKCGDPILSTFAGYDCHWQGKQDVYPHFINEAAYSSQNIAMALAEKKRIYTAKRNT